MHRIADQAGPWDVEYMSKSDGDDRLVNLREKIRYQFIELLLMIYTNDY